MGVDVVKKLKKEAQARQREGGSAPAAASKTAAPKYEPGGKFFVSNNWKKLLEARPNIAPKAAVASTPSTAPDGGAAESVVALDCEMVGVGPSGTKSVLARVSIVDNEGRVLLDKFVKPSDKITDYRTKITGITAATLDKKGVLSESVARRMAADIMKDKIVVGHSVHFDFEALILSHPHVLIRDTALFRPLRPVGREKKTPSLASLCEHWLHQTIRGAGTHDSVEDARMALRLYRLKSKMWEKQMKSAMSHHSPASAAASQGSDSQGFRPAPAPALTASAQDDSDGEAVERPRDSNGDAAPGGSASQNKGKKARARAKRLGAENEVKDAAAAKLAAKVAMKRKREEPAAPAQPAQAAAKPSREKQSEQSKQSKQSAGATGAGAAGARPAKKRKKFAGA